MRETPFDEIWKNAEIFRRLRTMDYKGGCGRCRYKGVCGGCRARAYAVTGDYMAEEPFCGYQPRGATATIDAASVK